MTIEKMTGCVRLEMVRSTINLGMSESYVVDMLYVSLG